MTARTELEHDAFCIAAGLAQADGFASKDAARQRASAFSWVDMAGDYQCPSCWVADKRASPLLPAPSTLPTEAHFGCPACGFHFVEQA